MCAPADWPPLGELPIRRRHPAGYRSDASSPLEGQIVSPSSSSSSLPTLMEGADTMRRAGPSIDGSNRSPRVIGVFERTGSFSVPKLIVVKNRKAHRTHDRAVCADPCKETAQACLRVVPHVNDSAEGKETASLSSSSSLSPTVRARLGHVFENLVFVFRQGRADDAAANSMSHAVGTARCNRV